MKVIGDDLCFYAVPRVYFYFNFRADTLLADQALAECVVIGQARAECVLVDQA